MNNKEAYESASAKLKCAQAKRQKFYSRKKSNWEQLPFIQILIYKIVTFSHQFSNFGTGLNKTEKKMVWIKASLLWSS